MTFWKLTTGVLLMIFAALVTTLICVSTTYAPNASTVVVVLMTYAAFADIFIFRFLLKKETKTA